MAKITIDAPEAQTEDDLANELRRIAGLVEQGYTSGEVHGGWWNLEDFYPERSEPDEDEDDLT